MLPRCADQMRVLVPSRFVVKLCLSYIIRGRTGLWNNEATTLSSTRLHGQRQTNVHNKTLICKMLWLLIRSWSSVHLCRSRQRGQANPRQAQQRAVVCEQGWHSTGTGGWLTAVTAVTDCQPRLKSAVSCGWVARISIYRCSCRPSLWI